MTKFHCRLPNLLDVKSSLNSLIWIQFYTGYHQLCY